LGVQRRHQDHTVRGAHGAQPAADMCLAGGQTPPGQVDGQRPQVSRQRAADG